MKYCGRIWGNGYVERGMSAFPDPLIFLLPRDEYFEIFLSLFVFVMLIIVDSVVNGSDTSRLS